MGDSMTVASAKRRLRNEMRAIRSTIPADERARRSGAICDELVELVDVGRVRTVLTYCPVPGEPDVSAFERWCVDRGIAVMAPDPVPAAELPVAVGRVDAFVVPGLAFTDDGGRLGQGGGWYDRLLSLRREDSFVIGVCFAEQLVVEVPVEAHDVGADHVVAR